MPFTASFTVTQALDGSTFTITDTSNYSVEDKSTFSSRLLYIYLWNGNTWDANGTVTTDPTPIAFSFASYPSDTITIPITSDYAFTISLVLTSTDPQPDSVYSVTEVVGFLYYLKSFRYSLSQYASANRSLFSNKNFYSSCMRLQTCIGGAETDVSYSDVWGAQLMISEGYKLLNKPTTYFA